jgi:hypothetical protein
LERENLPGAHSARARLANQTAADSRVVELSDDSLARMLEESEVRPAELRVLEFEEFRVQAWRYTYDGKTSSLVAQPIRGVRVAVADVRSTE